MNGEKKRIKFYALKMLSQNRNCQGFKYVGYDKYTNIIWFQIFNLSSSLTKIYII